MLNARWLHDGRAQRQLWKRTKFVWKAVYNVIISAGAAAAVVYIGFLFIEEFTRHAIEIAPISVTKDLNDQGYTPTVVAESLRDAVNDVIIRAKRERAEPIALKGEEPDITVPSVGLSIDTIVASISSHFNMNNVEEVSGEIVQRNEKLWLTLRTTPLGVAGVISADRNNPDALFALAARTILEQTEPYFVGLFLNEEGKHDEAIAEYREAILLDPRAEDLHIGLGYVLLTEDKYDEAAAEYREAIRLDPRDPYPHTLLGTVLLAGGKPDEAITECREAIRIDPRAAYAHYDLGYVLGDRDKRNAAAEYREAIRLDPRDPYPHNGLGVILDEDGRHDDAAAEFREARRLEARRGSAP